MKTHYSTILKSAAAGVALFMSLSAAAQNFTPIVSGETAQCNKEYVFTAPADGNLLIASTYAPHLEHLLYSSPSLSPESAITAFSSQFVNYGYTYFYHTEKDTEYYFYFGVTAMVEVPPTFTFTFIPGELPNQITTIDPKPSTSPYNLASNPYLSITFMRQESFTGDASIVYTTVDGAQASTPLYFDPVDKGVETVYEFGVKEALAGVKENIKDNSEFTVLIKNPKVGGQPLTGQYVGADGNVELKYMYVRQTSIVSAQWPDPFLSYWQPGNPDGIAQFTFDGPLASLNEMEDFFVGIFAGPYKDGEDWEMLPAPESIKIEGNTLTIDLCGVHRITNESVVTLYVEGLLAADGMSVDYNGSGAIHVYNIPYKLMKESELEYEFTPGQGSLADVDQVELWVQAKTFTYVEILGFRFDIEGNPTPVEVALADTDPQEDTFDPGSMIYLIPVPQAAKEAEGSVTLSAVLRSVDGNDYTLSTTFVEGTGVGAIFSDAASAPVYTVDGHRVKGSIDTLPAGLYISGGKKFIKK